MTTSTQNGISGLRYDTFISAPIPVATTDRVPNGDRRMFSPMTATLISGDRDAVLVDPPMTIEQTQAVGDWIERSGRNLTHIYLTHGHGDHWFGTAPLLRRFPGATAFATPGTIAMMRVHGSEQLRSAIWDAQFPGQIPDSPVLATTPSDNRFTLEGHELIALEVGHTDTDDTTVLHVPDLGLVVAGDVIYNNVHQYLREAQGEGIHHWFEAIDEVAALDPRYVVSGHKDGTRADDPVNIELTRQYLLDAERLLAKGPTALEFFDSMIALYPERLNPGALWSGATALLPSS
ncbi:MBL fold metallo-hydrolase [Herbiconiux sp. P17]|uniref:MBL fold metallo-hydrolase n=1 Tax=Herbiconiux wuyangfengii TaxID=3342794 RepID=UPI0035B70FEF